MFLRVILLFLAAILFAGPAFGKAVQLPEKPCADIEACLALIPELPGDAYGKGKLDVEIEKQILSYGRQALPGLVELIDHPNANVRHVSDHLIGELKGLTFLDLPLVQTALEDLVKLDLRGRSPNAFKALGVIKTREAANVLVEYIKITGNSYESMDQALDMLGDRGIQALLKELDCNSKCESENFEGFWEAFKYLGEKAAFAVEPLLDLALDEKNSIQSRKSAILNLGAIGKMAFSTAERLVKLAKAFPEDFLETTRSALSDMDHPLAIELVPLDWEEGFELHLLLSGISNNGEGAKYVGPKIVPFLKHSNWDVRVSAARALGEIGFKGAIPNLEEALKNKEDWHLIYTSIKALAMLEARSALPFLENLRLNYWYLPVRVEAERALNYIKFHTHKQALEFRDEVNFDPISFTQVGYEIEVCEAKNFPDFSGPSHKTLVATESQPLNQFEYEYPFCESIFDNFGNYVSCELVTLPATPDFATKIKAGWLTGDDRGEWGGEVVYFDEKGEFEIITGANPEAIYEMLNGIFGFEGLAHGFTNRGQVFSIFRNKENQWDAKSFVRLPGVPRTVKRISENEVLINTLGGSVIFDGTLNLKMASCEANKIP